MRRRLKRIAPDVIGEVWHTPSFLFVLVVFLCGVVAGGFTGILGNAGDSAQRLAAYFAGGAAGSSALPVRLLNTVGGTAVWLFVCLASGILTPPMLFPSLVASARGFSLAFAVATMVTQLGMDGVRLSLITAGLCAVVTVPSLLVTAAAACTAARETPQCRLHQYFYALGRYRGALALCAAASIAAATLRAVLEPLLLKLFA